MASRDAGALGPLGFTGAVGAVGAVCGLGGGRRPLKPGRHGRSRCRALSELKAVASVTSRAVRDSRAAQGFKTRPARPGRRARRAPPPTAETARRASPRGSRLSPVWTSEAWTMVDDGAASQPKRSDGGSAAIGPASAAPSATRTSAARCSRSSPEAHRRSQRRQPLLSPASTRAPRKPRWRQNRTTPDVEPLAALDAGDDAQDEVGERPSVRLGHARPPPRIRRRPAGGQILHVHLGQGRPPPTTPAGTSSHRRLDRALPQPARSQPLVGLADRSGPLQQHVEVGGGRARRERGVRRPRQAVALLPIQRGTVIDRRRAPAPPQ